MENKETLAERISSRLERHRLELVDRQQHVDMNMKRLLEQRERFAAAAGLQVETVILPRMEELNRRFANGKIELLQNDAFFIACEFAHTPRFPATARLSISLSPVDDARFIARYNLSILPVLMDYNPHAEELFPLQGNEDALAGWVEDRILDFVDTYLRLETHPLYQKDNMVVDIVCGMRIPSTAATSSLERQGRTFYFCSEHCKEAFIKGGY